MAPHRQRNKFLFLYHYGDPYGIRTRVAGVKGRCPRPLDEGVAGHFESWHWVLDQTPEINPFR